MGASGYDFALAKIVGSTPVTTTTSTTSTTSTTVPVMTSTVAAPQTVSNTMPSSTTSTVAPLPTETVILELPVPTRPLLADTTLEPGQSVVLEFGGFIPGEFVQLVVASTPRVIASGYANSIGFVRLSGDLPANLAAGNHSLALYAPESGRGVRQPISVQPVKQVKSLPATGGTNGVLLPISFIILGSAIMMLMRRCQWFASRS